MPTCCDLLLEETCSICGEKDPDAEMFMPIEDGQTVSGTDESFLVHAECGVQAGWEVS